MITTDRCKLANIARDEAEASNSLKRELAATKEAHDVALSRAFEAEGALKTYNRDEEIIKLDYTIAQLRRDVAAQDLRACTAEDFAESARRQLADTRRAELVAAATQREALEWAAFFAGGAATPYSDFQHATACAEVIEAVDQYLAKRDGEGKENMP